MQILLGKEWTRYAREQTTHIIINIPSKLCACVCVHTDHGMSAYKQTWSAHKFSFENVFAHIILNTDERL